MRCKTLGVAAGLAVLIGLLAAGLRQPRAASALEVTRPGPSIVAAESVYADIARQIAGPRARIIAILTNPASDPHDFEATPSTARALADATLVIANGAGYDPWVGRLTPAAVHTIVMAELLHRGPGDNPHLWFDPQAGPALVAALADALARADPPEAAAIRARSAVTLAEFAALQARIAGLRARFAGARIAATEPVFGPMIQAIGLQDTDTRLERAAMNGTEPRASDLIALQKDLSGHTVRALITNAQATGPATARLVALARACGVPIVPVTETLPGGQSYQAWLSGILDVLEAALSSTRLSPARPSPQ